MYLWNNFLPDSHIIRDVFRRPFQDVCSARHLEGPQKGKLEGATSSWRVKYSRHLKQQHSLSPIGPAGRPATHVGT